MMAVTKNCIWAWGENFIGIVDKEKRCPSFRVFVLLALEEIMSLMTTHEMRGKLVCLNTTCQEILKIPKIHDLSDLIPFFVDEDDKLLQFSESVVDIFSKIDEPLTTFLKDSCNQSTLIHEFYWIGCCGPSRPFEMKIFDTNQRQVAQFSRPFRCSNFWCPCFLQRLEVCCPPGNVVGYVEQDRSIFAPKFRITNAAGDIILKLLHPTFLWQASYILLIISCLTLRRSFIRIV